ATVTRSSAERSTSAYGGARYLDPQCRKEPRHGRERAPASLPVAIPELARAITTPAAQTAVGSRTRPGEVDLDRHDSLVRWCHQERQSIAHHVGRVSTRQEVT